MRTPEVRVTGTVGTIVTDTSFVVTTVGDDSQDPGAPRPTAVTVSIPVTAGIRDGERVEVCIRSLGG